MISAGTLQICNLRAWSRFMNQRFTPVERPRSGALTNEIKPTKIMRTKRIATWIAITLLTAGTTLAQGGPGRRSGGYGTPPKTEEERAARQADRQRVNRNNRTNRVNRAGQGQNWGRGLGRGNCDGSSQGNGPRDGSGPRGGTADCPLSN